MITPGSPRNELKTGAQRQEPRIQLPLSTPPFLSSQPFRCLQHRWSTSNGIALFSQITVIVHLPTHSPAVLLPHQLAHPLFSSLCIHSVQSIMHVCYLIGREADSQT